MKLNPALAKRQSRRLSWWGALAIAVAVCGAVCATTPLWTLFTAYDDEGYMLLTLAHYVKHGHLYTGTFSQYGPFYFYAQGIFFQLFHLPVTHDMGRLATLTFWVLSSMLGAAFIYRASRSIFLACAAGLCCMLTGSVLAYEPGHPQQVILPLYMAASCLSLFSVSSRNILRLFLLGCVAAALTFTKINVGVFFIAGLTHTLVCLLPAGRIRSIGVALTLAYAAVAPWLLMHSSFQHEYRAYCLLATACGVVVFACGALLRPDPPLPLRTALYSAAGLLAGTMLLVAATSLQGMPVDTLVRGVLINPLHHPNVFFLPLTVSRRAAPLLLATVIGLRFSGRSAMDSRWLNMGRCAVGSGAIPLLIFTGRIDWVVPLLPLVLIPQKHWQRGAFELFPRLFIVDLAITQFLEPFPVAGSQVAIAAAPMLLWAFLCLSDGIDGLRAARADTRATFHLEAVFGGIILAVFAVVAVSSAASQLRQLPPASRLTGAAWLHLPAEQESLLESIASNIHTNCEVLFTMPGMGSFNFWSGVPAPNGWNLTAWMKGFSPGQQAEILRIVQASPSACAILNRRLVRFWNRGEEDVSVLPLARYVMFDMPNVAEFGEYEIRVHPNRASPWLSAGAGNGQ